MSTTLSPYDTSLSFLYKNAVELGVPVRLVLVKPKNEEDVRFVDFFDLEDNKDAVFMTIFDFIRQIINNNPTVSLTELWESISKFRGDTYNSLELIPMWLHANPQFQVEDTARLQQVNTYLEYLNEPGRYNNMAEAINYYRTAWLPGFQRELAKDTQRVQQYIQAQDQIGRIDPVVHSPVIIDTIMINYDYPLDPGMNPLPDLFNSSRTSYLIPYVQYNIRQVKGQPEDQFQPRKIYKGRSIESRPDYNNVTLSSSQENRAQSIYLNVWMGANGDDELDTDVKAREGKKESFGVVTLGYLADLNLLRVIFTSPHTDEVDEQVIIARIHGHLPGLKPPTQDQIREVRVSGEFTLYGLGLIEIAFLHLVMNDPLFNAYLYLDESGKSFTEKNRVKVHYRGASAELEEGKGYRTSDKKSTRKQSAVTSTITQGKIEAGTTFPILSLDGRVQVVKSDKDSPVLNVRISRAASRSAVDKFLNILARLTRRYNQYAIAIRDYYLGFVPEYAQVLAAKNQTDLPVSEPNTGGRLSESGKQMSRNAKLRKYAGDVFVANYARRCQKERQPDLILNPAEEDAWKNREIQLPGGRKEKRQILAFPRETGRYHLVCPDDEFPYPGVQENKALTNRHEFPVLPCCFGTDQSNEPLLLTYYRGQTKPTKQTKQTKVRKQHIIIGDKVLDPGRIALIPTIISSNLARYDPDAGTFYRYGVPQSINSFIHCVATARQDPRYLSAPDPEEWVTLVRDKIFDLGVRPESLRQELFDMTNEEIIRYTRDQNRFFDPLLFYRAMELIFDCNIYIFVRDDKDPKTQRKTSMLQLPRHRQFHIRPPNPGKPVVLIMKHEGSDAVKLDYPQCELIIDQRAVESKITENIMQYSESMDAIMYSATSFVSRTISWQIYETPEPTLTARLNIYSNLNYPLIFGQIPVVGQFIDVAGKARIFILAPEVVGTTFSNLRIFLNIPPTAPLNVPEVSLADARSSLPPYNKLIEFLGTPIGVTTTVDRQYLTGLWFPLGDIQFGLYAPCQDYSWTEFSKLYPSLSLNSELISLTVNIPRSGRSESAIQRINYLSKAARFIDQIVKYLYLVAQPMTTNDFFARIASLLGPNKPDSTIVYDLSKIPRVLPQGSLQQIMSELARAVPSMFSGGRLIFYDQQMYEGLNFQLTRFAKTIRGLSVSPVQLRQIQGYYSNKTDFSFDPKHEFILGSLREYNVWRQTYVPSPSLQQRTIQNLKDNIQIRLNENAFTYQEPYTYQRSDNNTIGSSYDPRQDKFYQIQNVAGGELNRAIQVALTWHEETRNTGFSTEPYQSDDGLLPAYVVYKISPGGGVILKQNNSGEEDAERAIALRILDYDNNEGGPGTYAAMLPIL